MLGNASLYTSAPARIPTRAEAPQPVAEAEVRTQTAPARQEPVQPRPEADRTNQTQDSARVTTLGRPTLVDANGLIVLQEQNGGEQSDGRGGRNPFTAQANGAEAQNLAAGRGDAPDARAPAGVTTGAGQAAEGDEAPSGELTEAEKEQVQDLRKRDAEVRAHEQAHARVGGSYASAPSYEFETGPDGRSYAVGGHVSISTSPVQGDPQATIDKMDTVRRAALAPAEPSGQDLRVAAQADQTAQAARVELREQQADAVAEQQAPAENENGQEAEVTGTAPANDVDATGTEPRPTFAEGESEERADALLGNSAIGPASQDEDSDEVANPTGSQFIEQVGNGLRDFVGQASSFVASLIENGDAGTQGLGNSNVNVGNADQTSSDDRDAGLRSVTGSGRAGGEAPSSINLTI